MRSPTLELEPKIYMVHLETQNKNFNAKVEQFLVQATLMEFSFIFHSKPVILKPYVTNYPNRVIYPR